MTREKDGRLERADIPWTRERPGGPLESVLCAMFRVEPGRLTVEVNSKKRAAAASRLVTRRLGPAARLRATLHEPVEPALRDSLADPRLAEKMRAHEERQALLMREHPELREAVEQHLFEHYRRWVDTPLPAFGGKTPREAMRTPAGRRQVRELVDGIERLDERKPGHQPRVDVGWIRRELGLAES